jgi:ribonucleoside-diphosphate reductase alpha chain
MIAREDDGQEQVYNFTEPLHHSYIVDGFVVANCSEYMHVDDSACNLASLNLMKFRRPNGTFDVESYVHAVDVMFLAQEIVVGPSSYPTEEIGVNARAFRQLGLGYANLGAFLMSNGVAYDSDAGRGTAAAITSLMTGRAYLGSARIAAAIGPYERYAENRDAHNAVMRMHRDASHAIPDGACSDTALLEASRAVWDEAVAAGDAHGYRNAQASVLAPTGTISFLMDCDTTGVEPDFSLVKFKELVGGGQMTIVNQTIPMALRTLGYSDEQIEQIEHYVNQHATIVGAPYLAAEHLSVFDVAVGERAISHMGHIKMMGAVQPFISGAISKTINMPNEATVEDIADAYLRAWHLGIKALAIYRDGSKTAQALRTDAHEGKSAPTAADPGYSQEQVDALVAEATAATRKATLSEVGPKRNRMPRERHSITHKFSIAGHEGYITAGMYEDGTVGEIFLTDIGKEGSTLRGMMNARAEVQLHALRARGHHPEPRDPVRQVDARLHHALARVALPGHRHPGGARHPHARGPRAQDGRRRRHLRDLLRHGPALERRQRRRQARPSPRPDGHRRRHRTSHDPRRRRSAHRHAPSRPRPHAGPRPRPRLLPVRRHDAAHRLVLHVLELREQHGVWVMECGTTWNCHWQRRVASSTTPSN